jgi:hypothetical protein
MPGAHGGYHAYGIQTFLEVLNVKQLLVASVSVIVIHWHLMFCINVPYPKPKLLCVTLIWTYFQDRYRSLNCDKDGNISLVMGIDFMVFMYLKMFKLQILKYYDMCELSLLLGQQRL